jgi:hypothetical protein
MAYMDPELADLAAEYAHDETREVLDRAVEREREPRNLIPAVVAATFAVLVTVGGLVWLGLMLGGLL